VSSKQPGYSHTAFDALLALPLAVYLLIIAALIVGVFITITPDAIRQAFADPALLHAIKLSLVTSLASTALAVIVAIRSVEFSARFSAKRESPLSTSRTAVPRWTWSPTASEFSTAAS